MCRFLLSRSIAGIRIHEPGFGIRIPRTQLIRSFFRLRIYQTTLWNLLFLVRYPVMFRIRIHWMLAGTDPDSGFLWPKWKNINSRNFFFIFWSKLLFTYHCGSLKNVNATGETFSPEREHTALQNMRFLNFFIFFGSCLALWIRIHWPDWIRIRITDF